MDPWLFAYCFGALFSGLFFYAAIGDIEDRIIWSIVVAMAWPIIIFYFIWIYFSR